MDLATCLKKMELVGVLAFATVDSDGAPQIRNISAIHYESDAIYFFTARGKNFCRELLEDGRVQIESDTLVPYKHVELPQSSIHAEVVGNANTYTIALQSNVYTPFVEVDFTDADVILSDNIINLTDDKPHVISFETKDVINGSFTDATDVKNRLRIRSLRDTY